MINSIKELLGITDRDWLTQQPLGAGIRTTLSNKTKWNPSTSTLLAYQRCPNLYMCIEEIYVTESGNFVIHNQSRIGGTVDSYTMQVVLQTVLGLLEDGEWQFTQEGQQYLQKIASELPEI